MTAFSRPSRQGTSPAQIILHLDLDAFFCAVEELRQPELRQQPFAVGGRPGERGVVSSCSYAARRFGIRSGMPMTQALRLYPGLKVVSGRHRAYGEMSDRVMERLQDVTPGFEQISIDEAFLDITGLHEPPERLARRLQTGIRDDLGLPSSIGIASSKLVAKIATEVGKKAGKGDRPPFGLTIVPLGEERAFLAPLPMEMLWGVGPKTAGKLATLGMRTIGDIAGWPESSLVDMFGDYGRELARRARGEDDRMVVTEHEAKSMSQETTFARDLRDDKALERTVRQLASEVAGYLRKSNLAGSTIRLKLRWPDFTTLTRQTTLSQRTDDEGEIAGTALELLSSVRKPGQAVRLIGVGVSGLGYPIRQLELWDTGRDRSRRLTVAIDTLRDKFGETVIHRGDDG
ncbi:MAG: DNA polymerase IV [Chloroflexota bacterium]